MNGVEYTHHARDKFNVLTRHGFVVTLDQVEETVLHPEKVIPQPGGRFMLRKGSPSAMCYGLYIGRKETLAW